MKKLLSLFATIALASLSYAQAPMGNKGISRGGHPMQAQRKFVILVENEREPKVIQETNERLIVMQDTSRNQSQRGLLSDLLWTGFTSSFKQKTVNATSNLASLGLSYVSEALKSKREKWYSKASQQCHYHQSLSAESSIDDFYALPSVKGSMDPENLKFKGFGLKNYIQVAGDSKEGVGVFYIFCKMRRDSLGLRHIVNHSKFLVEIDSLVVNPKYCNLPNDSSGSVESRFDFNKRDNLTINIKAKFYSSWMNQATMIADNQLLGDFSINIKVDKKKLNADSLFVYDRNDPDFEKLVSIDGDCFIVPRSYTGTTDGVSYQPAWGTGQYRVEMEVSEDCKIVDSYYLIRESGNGQEVAFAQGTPGKKKWNKAVWKVEWNAMKERRKNASFLNNAWNCIVTAYKGSGWLATLTDPITTALYSWETEKLDNWVNDIYTVSSIKASSTKSAGSVGSAASPTSPSGNTSNPGASGGKPANKSGGPSGGTPGGQAGGKPAGK